MSIWNKLFPSQAAPVQINPSTRLQRVAQRIVRIEQALAAGVDNAVELRRELKALEEFSE